MNYNTLVEQIKAYTNTTDPVFIAQIPNFITQGMSYIYSVLDCIGQQKTSAFNTVANNTNANLPPDLKNVLSIGLRDPNTNEIFLLYQRAYEVCLAYNPDPTVTGVPKFYSLDTVVPPVQIGPQTVYLSPTPDRIYAGYVTFESYPPPFAADQNQTNYFTDRYPNLVLSSSLCQAIPYLKSDNRIPVWQAALKAEVDNVKADAARRISDRLTNRTKV